MITNKIARTRVFNNVFVGNNFDLPSLGYKKFIGKFIAIWNIILRPSNTRRILCGMSLLPKGF